MRLTRFLKPGQVKLELDTRTPDEIPEGWSRDRYVWHVKSQVLAELLPLFEASGKVVNSRKLATDLENRERKSSTALGGGIAVPHVRTMQSKAFTMCFARSTPGVEFDAPDGEPVHFFIGVLAPPYDDKLYLEVYREIGTIFGTEEAKEKLRGAGDEHEVIKILSEFRP